MKITPAQWIKLVQLISTFIIGEEIFCEYGEDYWDNWTP